MSLFYAPALIFAIFAKILLSQDDPAAIWLIFGNICAGCMWGLAISSLINGILKALNNFRYNIYGNGALLTRCLPTTLSRIFLEKFLIGALLSLTSIIIATLAVLIVYAPYDQISAILDLIQSTTNTNNTAAILLILAIFYVEILLVFSAGTFGIVLGRKHLRRKNLWSVIYGFLAYLAAQAFIIGGIAIVGIFEPDVLQLFNPAANLITPTAIKTATITSAIAYAVCTLIFGYISGHIIAKGVDIG